MVTGERAELRGLNLEGLRRNGFTMSEVWNCVTMLSHFGMLPNNPDFFFLLGVGRWRAWEQPIVRYSCLPRHQVLKSVSRRWYLLLLKLFSMFLSLNLYGRNIWTYCFWCLIQEHDPELYSVPAVGAMLQSIRDSFAEGRRGICKFRQWLGSWVFTASRLGLGIRWSIMAQHYLFTESVMSNR